MSSSAKTAPTWGVYVHIPWCRTRCPYCAFTVLPDRGSPYRAYTDAVLAQWRALRDELPGRPDTIFFGGGTPSLHPPEQIAEIIQAIDPLPGAEISCEMNPGTLQDRALSVWLDAGITRASIGVQTFDPRFARILNRAHSVDEARALVERVASAGFESWSVDVIFAVPGQTPEDFETDLRAILDADPPHVSLYGLTAEPDTPYARAVELGRLTPPDEDDWGEMYDRAIAALEEAGLRRYEVSNLARPGHRCRHNEHYWRGRPYAGLGIGAHGFLPDGQRTRVGDDLAAFLSAPGAARERPSPRAAALDLLISTLRHIDGIPDASLNALGFRLDPTRLAPLARAEMLTRRDGNWALDEKGWSVGDAISRWLADTLESTSARA